MGALCLWWRTTSVAAATLALAYRRNIRRTIERVIGILHSPARFPAAAAFLPFGYTAMAFSGGLFLGGAALRTASDRVLTERLHVRILSGEPNNPTANSLSFRLTAERHGLA
jgi:hypothetical protein